VSEPTIFKSDHSYFILTDVNFTSSVEFQPRAQIFINPGCMLKFYGSVTTPEFTSSRDMWKITSGKEIYSTSPVIMDFDSYYSAVNFYGDEINLKSSIVRYGSNGLATININSTDFNYIVLRDCGTAIIINHGNLNIRNLVILNCNHTCILYTCNLDENYNIYITKCLINSLNKRGIAIQNIYNYYINNCYFNNNNIDIDINSSNGIISNNIFDNNNNYNITYYNNCHYNKIIYNNFYVSTICIRPQGDILNINNNNFFGNTTFFIYILRNTFPYSYVYSDVNAINNYWAVEDIDYYLADAEDDPRCPYHIIYLPKLSNPVKNAGIQ